MAGGALALQGPLSEIQWSTGKRLDGPLMQPLRVIQTSLVLFSPCYRTLHAYSRDSELHKQENGNERERSQDEEIPMHIIARHVFCENPM